MQLANTLAQNCGKDLHGELASRSWTTSLERLVNDRVSTQAGPGASRLQRQVKSKLTKQSTNATVKKKALGYIKDWAKQFEGSGDANLGLVGELYDQLRAKSASGLPFSAEHA